MSSEQQLSPAKLAKSYIWYGKQCFFVSTIDRESSAALVVTIEHCAGGER